MYFARSRLHRFRFRVKAAASPGTSRDCCFGRRAATTALARGWGQASRDPTRSVTGRTLAQSPEIAAGVQRSGRCPRQAGYWAGDVAGNGRPRVRKPLTVRDRSGRTLDQRLALRVPSGLPIGEAVGFSAATWTPASGARRFRSGAGRRTRCWHRSKGRAARAQAGGEPRAHV